MKEIEELTLRLLDGELDDEGVARLEELVGADDEARRIFAALLEQEGALRGEREGEDLSALTVEAIRSRVARAPQAARAEQVERAEHAGRAEQVERAEQAERAEQVERGVMQKLRDRRSEPEAVAPVERLSPWAGRRFAWLAAAAVLLAVGLPAANAVRTQMRSVPSEELAVLGQWTATPGMTTAYRVLVRDGETGDGIENADVELRMVDGEGELAWKGEATTGADGVAQAEVAVPSDLRDGDYSLEVSAKGTRASLETARQIRVERSFRLYLSTDKPRYQPGQLVHMRALALGAMKGEPAAGREVLFEVHDAKGNKVFKKRIETSEYGIVASDFQLADHVNMGDFRVVATLGDTVSERTVTVERYRLPKFRVDVSTGRGYYRPGETVRGEVVAEYTFGEPVADAEVELVGSHLVERLRAFETMRGRTDAAGRWSFELELRDHFVGTPLEQGDAMITLDATVTDGAGHEQTATVERTVTDETIHVDLVPESGELVPGVDNTVYVVTSYPDGEPAPARVEVSPLGTTLQTDEAGFGELVLPAGRIGEQLAVTARDGEGRTVTTTPSLPTDSGGEQAVLLRTDRALYRAGDTVELDVLTSGRAKRVFVDVVKDRQTMLTETLDLEKGRAAHVLDLPPGLSGTLAISAYHLPGGADIVRDTRLVQVRPAEDLTVEAEVDRASYRPGETATLDLRVLRGGEPTAAAVSLWGVDEAVFALSEMRPGLEKVYFALREEMLEPRYEIHAHALPAPRELVEPTEGRGREGAGVLLAAAKGGGAPERHAGETYDARMASLRADRDEARDMLLGALALLPALAFLLLALPILLYAGKRLVRRTPVEDATEAQRVNMRWSFRGLTLLWAVGLYLPLIAAATVHEAVGYRYEEEMGIGAGVCAGLLVLVGLGWTVWSIRRAEPARALPWLRRAMLFVPLAYAAAGLGVAGLVVGAQERWIGGELAVVVGLSSGAVAMLVTGAVALAGRAAIGAIPGWRAWTIALSRPVLVALPFACAIGMSTGVMRMESAEPVPVQGEAMPEGVMAPEQMAAGQPRSVTAKLEDAEATGEDASLKAPTRIRRHFPETLLWKPHVVTGADGEAQVEIPLADSITTWRIGAGAVSSGGLLGSETIGIRVFQDFFVDIDLPVALTQNDEVEAPVAIYNYLDEPQTVRLDLEAGDWYRARGGRSRTVRLEPGQITEVSFPIVAKRPGEHALTVRASGTEMADAVQRRIRVEPDGERVVDTRNGRLKARVTEQLLYPEGAIPGANELLLKIYPGSFSQVMEGLDGILRMPHGCFEQTSSATYPNVLVLDYLQRTDQAKPDVEMKATEYIETGYQRLLSFEVDGGGFEWFGKAPAHNVLTAYGLLELTDMAEVYEVEPAVIQRTRSWLLDQQEGDGSWEPTSGGISEGAINAYQGQTLRTTAYIAWALGEAGADDPRVGKALDWMQGELEGEQDPYTLALAANALLSNGREAGEVLGRLAGMAKKEDDLAHWASSGEGVTHSMGGTLDVETTALAAYALLEAQHSVGTAHAALAWLVEQRDPHGTWSSTQATVHAMRALLLGTESAGGELDAPVRVEVAVNGETVETVEVAPQNADVFRTVDVSSHVRTGDNTVALDVSGEGNLAYQVVGTHYRPWAEGAGEREEPLSIDVSYDTRELSTDDELTARVTLAYNRPGVAKMTLVDLGIPPGFELLPGAFERMKRDGVIERYTVTGTQVVLYFRELEQGKPVSFAYDMRAKYPLRVKTPRTSAYQYYEPDLRDETEPVELTVRGP